MKSEDYFDSFPVRHLNNMLGDNNSQQQAGKHQHAPYQVDYLLTFDSYLQQLNDTITAQQFELV